MTTVFQIRPSPLMQHTHPVSPHRSTNVQFITLDIVTLVLVTRDKSQDVTAMKRELQSPILRQHYMKII